MIRVKSGNSELVRRANCTSRGYIRCLSARGPFPDARPYPKTQGSNEPKSHSAKGLATRPPRSSPNRAQGIDFVVLSAKKSHCRAPGPRPAAESNTTTKRFTTRRCVMTKPRSCEGRHSIAPASAIASATRLSPVRRHHRVDLPEWFLGPNYSIDDPIDAWFRNWGPPGSTTGCLTKSSLASGIWELTRSGPD